jgi:DNA-3-methyladenine glycosylase
MFRRTRHRVLRIGTAHPAQHRLQRKEFSMTEYFGRQYVDVDADFFAPPAAEVAPRLIGCVLHHDNRGIETAIMLIDVEAYGGGNDRASHLHPENRSRRNKGAKNLTPHGTARIHGSRDMWGLDIVCGEEGQGSTVLVRAGLPGLGEEIMAERRSKADAADRVVKDRARGYEKRLCNAPFNLGEAMGLCPVLDGASLFGHPLRLLRPADRVAGLLNGPRVRVTQDVDLLWRWGHRDHQAWLKDKFKKDSE